MKQIHKIVARVSSRLTLPEVYVSIAELIRQPRASIADYVKVVGDDSSLCLCLIRMANTPFFGFSRRVTNVRQAISVLGVIQLHDLVLSGLAIRAFDAVPMSLLDRRGFWRDSVCCGVIAKLLAQTALIPATNRFFTFGLIHEVGHLILCVAEPEATEEIIVQSVEQGLPPEQLQRERWGFDYADVGAELMEFWHLPEFYADIIKGQVSPQLAKTQKKEKAIVNLAHYLVAHDVLHQRQLLDEAFMHQCSGWELLKFELRELSAVLDRTEACWEEVAACLLNDPCNLASCGDDERGGVV